MKRFVRDNRGWIVLAWAMVCLLFWIFSTAHFVRSLLVANWFCLSIVLGSLWYAMLHHLVGGAWGFLIRRFGESLGRTLPLIAVLMLPIALDFKAIYPWADASFWQHDPASIHRRAWLNGGLVFVRGVILFAVWIYFAFKLYRESIAQDRNDLPADRQPRLELLSRGGLVVAFVTVTLAGVDWIMSRDPHWYSTAFGMLLVVSQSLCGLSACILLLNRYRNHPDVRRLLTPDRLHDLGNLLLMTMVLWAYISFFQFLVIWMGNEQEEIVYYHQRNVGGWKAITVLLMVCNFALPFMGLLSQKMKRDLKLLSRIAGLLLAMQFLFVLWMIAPSGRGEGPGGVYWSDLFVIPFVVGLWGLLTRYLIAGAPPVPLYQPESEIQPEVAHDAQLAAD